MSEQDEQQLREVYTELPPDDGWRYTDFELEQMEKAFAKKNAGREE